MTVCSTAPADRAVGAAASSRSLGAAAWGAFLALAACTSTTPGASDVLKNPRSMAVLCEQGAGFTPAEKCSGAAGLRAYISGGSIGSIAIAAPAQGTWRDTDPSVPGFTPKMLGDLPQAVVADPLDGAKVYVLSGLSPRIGVLDAKGLAVSWQNLPFLPTTLAATVRAGAVVLWLADTDGGAVWRLPAAAIGGNGAPQQIKTGGSPWSLAVHPEDGRVFVGHLRDNHVTVVADDGSVAARVGIGPACANGLDDDGDGLIDASDRGCDDGVDASEADPELGAVLCSDNIDNDADGAIDALDAGCAATPTVDHCRNGIDDDGDGHTDFPDDDGCVGFAGRSEHGVTATCYDGIDNEGDGLTDVQDPACAGSDGSEASPAAASAMGPCNNGLDDDGDGLTDHPADPDCGGPLHHGELLPPCADGIDNDADGLTDLADAGCSDRRSPSEAAPDLSPAPALALADGGTLLAVGHRARSALLLLDTQTLQWVVPVVGADKPFLRPSRLDARDGLIGLALPNAPLAMAAVQIQDRPALAVTLSMTGLVIVQLRAAPEATGAAGPRQVALLEQLQVPQTVASKPTLTVDGKAVDLGGLAPARQANPGPLDTDNATRYYGLRPSEAIADHRSELWRLVYQGQLPGSERGGGTLAGPRTLVDPGADFCRMGVVPGDLLILHRATAAAPCGALPAGNLRWRVAAVEVDRLHLDAAGAIDVPVTASNQLAYVPGAAVPALEPACFVPSGVRYELRTDGWLVEGTRSGILSSRGHDGHACAPWQPADPLQASRIVEPTAKAGAAPQTCPLSATDLAAMELRSYGAAAAGPVMPFANAVFSLQMQPGCVAADVPGEAPRLLPSVRDATWRYVVTAGVRPAVISVGAAAVAIAAVPHLHALFAVDQGSGLLVQVDLLTRSVVRTLD